MRKMISFRWLWAVFFLSAWQAAFAGPKIDFWTTSSGARVYFVENHALPILDVQVDFPAGSARDPEGMSGLASLVHSLLELGTEALDEMQIADKLADVGAQISGGVELDRASVSLRTLSAVDKRDAALAVYHAVLSSPRFPTEVLERERARKIAALKESLTRPGVIASRAFWASLYPGHVYGRAATPESLAAITSDDLEQFYRRHYRASSAVVTLVGDLNRSEAERIAQTLTAGLPSGKATSRFEPLPIPRSGEQRLAHPAAQAHVLLGLPALKRGDPDFFALQVGNYTLGGGGFVSRLMREVREKRGFAYSVYSYFMPLEHRGPFQIGLQTKKEQADEALSVARDVLTGFLADGPTEEELVAAKQNLAGSFPLRLDSNRKILDHVAVIGFYDLPLDYLDTYVANVEKVTAEDVRAAFLRHVRLEHLVTVVVGSTDK